MSTPRRLILAVNAGSSSLKISLYNLTKDEPQNTSPEPINLILTSSISNISAPPAKFSFKGPESSRDESVPDIKDHAGAFAYFLDYLKEHADIDRSQIAHICHRVVHGGDYQDPVIISDETYHHIERLSDLAPLHNGSALSVIKACIEKVPNANSIAFFDTAFHRSIPPHIASYAIDQTIAKKRGLKKYGFHGLSYAFILRAVSAHLQKPHGSLNLILLHLGSGASACAIQHGKSLDTSMGLTPLNGLPGATRSGAIDPSLIFHYTNKAGRISHDPKAATNLHVTQAEDILNTKSGWKALAGTTDFAVITARAGLGAPAGAEPRPERLAFDLFADRVLDFVGAYFVKLGGEVDALVFSGGIGERSEALRREVGARVQCLGFAAVDEELNAHAAGAEGVVCDIGAGEGRRVLVCRTDEQLEMARQCALDARFWEE